MTTNCKDLDEWLAIATSGLTEGPTEVLREEIGSHYEQAVQFYQEQGGQITEAQHAALCDLGDPSVARRHFQRTYLTQRDWEHLVRIGKVPRLRGWRLLVFSVGIGSIFYLASTRILDGEAVLTLHDIGLTLAVAISIFSTRMLGTSPTAERIYGFAVMHALIFGAFALSVMGQSATLSCGMIVIGALSGVRYLIMARKLAVFEKRTLKPD